MSTPEERLLTQARPGYELWDDVLSVIDELNRCRRLLEDLPSKALWDEHRSALAALRNQHDALRHENDLLKRKAWRGDQ